MLSKTEALHPFTPSPLPHPAHRMPKAVGVYEPLSVNDALPVQAIPVGNYAGGPVLAGAAVVEGKMMRQVATNRACQDVAWAVIFLVGLGAAFAAGISGISGIDSMATNLKKCEPFLKSPQFGAVNKGLKPGSDTNEFNLTDEAPKVFIALAAVFGVAVVVAVFYLLALEKQARIVTWGSVCMMPVFFFLGGLYEFGLGATSNDSRCAFGNCQIGGMIGMCSSIPVALIILCVAHTKPLVQHHGGCYGA